MQVSAAYVVVPGGNAAGDVVVPMFDCAPLLAGEQIRAGGDGEVEVGLVRDEVDLEAVEPGRLV